MSDERLDIADLGVGIFAWWLLEVGGLGAELSYGFCSKVIGMDDAFEVGEGFGPASAV